jgi:hypothetical protein
MGTSSIRWFRTAGEVVDIFNFDFFAEYLSREAPMIFMLSSECIGLMLATYFVVANPHEKHKKPLVQSRITCIEKPTSS